MLNTDLVCISSNVPSNEIDTKHFEFTNILDDFSSDFCPDDPLYSKIQRYAEYELSESINSCINYEINGTHSGNYTNKRYFIQMMFDDEIIEWEYTGDV